VAISGQLMQLGVPRWVSPLLVAEVIQWAVVVGGFLFISRVTARQIGLRWDAVPSGLVGGLLVWGIAQAIAVGPTEAIVASRSATPLLFSVLQGSGLLLAYAAVGILEETEFRGILLGQIIARLRRGTGAAVASVVALVASTAFFTLLHEASYASLGWTDLRVLPVALQEVGIMGLASGCAISSPATWCSPCLCTLCSTVANWCCWDALTSPRHIHLLPALLSSRSPGVRCAG
jgi:membrane protease YdiL (CAAX protease family)